MSLTITVMTPEKTIWTKQTTEAIIPSSTGIIGILNGHANLVTIIDTGMLRIRLDNKWIPLILLGGFAEIENNTITILVSGVEELTNNLDKSTTEIELTEALKNLKDSKTNNEKLKAITKVKRLSAKVQAIEFL